LTHNSTAYAVVDTAAGKYKSTKTPTSKWLFRRVSTTFESSIGRKHSSLQRISSMDKMLSIILIMQTTSLQSMTVEHKSSKVKQISGMLVHKMCPKWNPMPSDLPPSPHFHDVMPL